MKALWHQRYFDILEDVQTPFGVFADSVPHFQMQLQGDICIFGGVTSASSQGKIRSAKVSLIFAVICKSLQK
ncbi:hypothetical protein ACLB1Q_20830 [Escherichia coli]